MRDQHRVQVPWRGGRRALAAQMRHTGAEHGIGQQPHTAQIEEYSRMTQIGDGGGRLRVQPIHSSRGVRQHAGRNLAGPKLVALSLGGIALTAGTAVLTASNHPPDTAALAATARALMVGIPFAVGLYAWRRGLRERFGVLLMLMAVLASLTTLAESGNDVAYSSGRVAGWVFEVGLVYLMLSFPTRSPVGRGRPLARGGDRGGGRRCCSCPRRR